MNFLSWCKKAVVATLSCLLVSPAALGDEERFSDYEIRVIKNKTFTKRLRLELDVGLGGVMNQSFHDSYLAMAGLGFHFSEEIGIHGEYVYGFNRNKEECETLGSDRFLIAPVLNVLDGYYGGYLTYTPIYGKYQLGSGDVLYFDWFFRAGGGLATNRELEGGVASADRKKACGEIEMNQKAAGSTLQANVGTGQRYFLGRNVALVWNLKFLMYQPSREGSTFIDNGIKNVILDLGIGYFL